MKSIDLFSGIGGMTRSIESLGIRPVAYCDIDPKAQRLLQSLQTKRRLPPAPVHGDVKTFRPKTRVDIVVAGFPCQGFSDAGSRQGLRHEGSGLVREVFRIVKDTRPRFVFLENVATILNAQHRRDVHTIVSRFSSMGYDGRLVTMHGYDVGCPQKRERVYFLFAMRGATATLTEQTYRPFKWTRATEPPRFVTTPVANISDRIHLLGNSVIPDMTRLAFLFLWTGFTLSATQLATKTRFQFVPVTPPPAPTHRDAKLSAATCINGDIIAATKPRTKAYTPPTIVLDPRVFSRPGSSRLSLPPLTRPVSVTGWSTVRTKSTGANNVLTKRSIRDVTTQMRFATTTPNAIRGGYVNPEFMEWLMGYPRGWTARTERTAR